MIEVQLPEIEIIGNKGKENWILIIGIAVFIISGAIIAYKNISLNDSTEET